jgi:hypothetical protein
MAEPAPPRVREDCRHFIGRSTAGGERVERCRVEANLVDPFACPPDCLFWEARKVSGAGWAVPGDERPPS